MFYCHILSCIVISAIFVVSYKWLHNWQFAMFRCVCLFQHTLTFTHLYLLLTGFVSVIAVSVLTVQIYNVYRYFHRIYTTFPVSYPYMPLSIMYANVSCENSNNVCFCINLLSYGRFNRLNVSWITYYSTSQPIYQCTFWPFRITRKNTNIFETCKKNFIF